MRSKISGQLFACEIKIVCVPFENLYSPQYWYAVRILSQSDEAR